MAFSAKRAAASMKKNGYSAPAHIIHSDEDTEQQRAEKEARKQALSAQQSYNEYKKKYGTDMYQGMRDAATISMVASPDMASESMADYARYKNTQGAQLATYDTLSDATKSALGRISKTKKDESILGFIPNPFGTSGDLENGFKEQYGIDDDTLKALEKTHEQALERNDYNKSNGDGAYEQLLQDNAKENYVRTYKEELQYATDRIADATDDVGGLRENITRYNKEKRMEDEANSPSQSGAAFRALMKYRNDEDYINQLKSDTSKEAQAISGVLSEDNAASIKQQTMKKYNLSDDEFEDLAYYGGELDNYDARIEQQEKAQSAVNTGDTTSNIAGGIKNSAIALVANPYAGLRSAGATAAYKLGIDGRRDKHSPLDVNGDGFAYTNMVSDYQGATQNAISNWNTAAGLVYGAGMSAAESLETSILAPMGAGTAASVASKLGAGAKGIKAAAKVGQTVAGLTPFGANAFASALSENVSSGAEMDDAMTDALISAGIEVGTELLPFDHFWEIAKGNSRTARKVITDFIAQSGIEGLEEVAGDVADYVIDQIRNGDESDFNKSVQAYMETPKEDGTFMTEDEARSLAQHDLVIQTLQDFATGAMSGAMGGAGATAIGVYTGRQNANEMFDNFTQQDYADFAKGLNTDESTYENKSAAKSMQQAKTLAEKYAQQETVTDKERRKLYYAYSDAVNTEEEAKEKKKEKTQKKTDSTGNGSRDGLDSQAYSGMNDSSADTEVSAQRAEQDRAFAENMPEELRPTANDYSREEIHKRMTRAANVEDLQNVLIDGMASNNEQTRRQTAQSLEMLTPMLNKNISMEEIESLKQSDADIIRAGYNGDEVSLFTSRQKQLYNHGQQQAIEARTATNNEQRERMAQNAAKIRTEAGRKAYQDGYQTGMNAAAYDRIANSVMAAGRNGMAFDEAMDRVSTDLAAVGGDEQALRTSMEGMYSYAQEQAKTDAVTEAARALREQSGVREWGNGTVTDARTGQKTMLPEMRTLEFLAKTTGLNYVIADNNYTVDGEKVFDEDSQGEFKWEKSTIYLNADQREQMAGTAIHEVYEFDAMYNPEETAIVTRAVHQALLKSLGSSKYNNLLEAYRRGYAGEANKTDLDLDKEIVADMAPILLTNEKSLRQFVDEVEKNSTPKEAQTIKEKLADWLNSIADALRDFLSSFKPTSYQQQVAEAQIENIEELRDMLIKTTANAVQHYQQARMEALAQTLGIDANPNTVVETVTTQEDAFQIAYDNFANTVDDIAVYKSTVSNDVSRELEVTFIDVARAFKQSVSGDEAKLHDVEEIIDVCRNDLFIDDEQNRNIGIRIDGYTPVYKGIGTHNVPHSDTYVLMEYRPHGKRVDAYLSIGNLFGAINAYEQKFGITDDTVKGFLDEAKKAVNGIQEAMDNGYAAADGADNLVTYTEGEYFKKAMKGLEKYALTHVKGFRKGDINNRSTSASLRNIDTWQANRNYINKEELSGEGQDAMAGENRDAVPDVRNSRSIKEQTIIEVDGRQMAMSDDGTVATDEDGKIYAVVTLGEFSNKKVRKSWSDVRKHVATELAKIAGKKITIKNDGTEVYADNKFANEFLWSKDTKGGDYRYKKTKVSAYNNIETIVREATYLKWEPNKEKKHRKDAKRGWRYYAVNLLVRQGDNAKIYNAILNIRMSNDGKDYIYDITQINKAADQTEENPHPINMATSNQNVAPQQFGVNGNTDSDDVRRSRVIEDTIGRELSERQQEYFKDSKAVDDDGRLKIMYHGTTNANFTVFNPVYSDDGISLFFTDRIGTASTYSDTYDVFAPTADDDAYQSTNSIDAASMNYCVYLDIKNPMVVDYEGRYWNEGELRNRKDVVRLAKRANKALSNEGTSYGLERYIDEWISYDNRNHDFETYVESTGSLLSVSAEERNAIHTISDMLENEFFQMVTDGAVGADVTDMLFDGTIQYNTRDYVREAKANGYDGVIFKNVIDEGPFGEMLNTPSTVMVAFDSNQVKSVNNQNPTEDVDIRRSMKIDDSRNMNNEEISSSRDEVAGILERGADALKGTSVNKMAVRNIAMEMKREYGSAIDLEQFTGNLRKMFGYLHSGKSINYNDFVAVMQDVARPVIDAAYTTQASREDFAQFRNGINELSFSLTPEQTRAIKSAFGSMKAFERYYPEIHITEDGKSFAEQWGSLVELSGGLLDENTDVSDMPTELVDVMESLRPSMNTWEDNTQAAHDLALDIISRYLANYHDDGANKAVVNEFVKTAEKEIKARQKEWRSKVKADYDERLRAERAYQKEIAGNRAARIRRRSEEQIAKLRAKNATRIKDIRERQKRNAQLQQINKTVGTLYQYMANPTDQNHVPKDLQEPIMQLMASLDMAQPSIRQGEDGKWHTKILAGRTVDETTGRYSYEWKEITADTREDAIRQYNEALADGMGSAGARKWYDRMQDLADMYSKKSGDKAFSEDNSQDMMDFLQGLNSELAEDFDRIIREAKESGKASVAALGSEDLKTINNVLKNVLHAVNAINKSLTLPSTEISEISGGVMDKADTVNGRKNMKRWKEQFVNFFSLSNANPRTYFHAIGADKVIDILINAQNQKAWRLKEAQEYNNHLLDGFSKKEIKSWDKEQSYLGGKVKATKAQMMTLYELLKRPDAQLHLLAGGFKVGSINDMTTTQNRVIHLTMEEYNALIDEALTDREKAVADGMQRFMAVNCSAWGNETSMTLYGYEKFLDDYYWPMTVDKTSVNTNTSEMMSGIANTIKNMGITKATVSNASNALVLNGAMDVYAKHISDMAVYGSWAAPVQDLLRFFNYRETEFDENNGQRDTRSTKEAIERLFGTGGTDYFKKLMASIQGTEQSSFEDPGNVGRMIGNAKKAAVMANIRVAIQQPTAIVRAGRRLEYKYLMEGVASGTPGTDTELKRLQQEMIDSDAVYWIKQQGNIDGFITSSIKSQITGIQDDVISDKAGWLAGEMDRITWDAMYRACIAKEIDVQGRDKIGTQEFKDAVNYRFDHLMLETQVYDGTITRSQFMRSTDQYAKNLSAFMAEPTKTYNLFLSDAIDFMQADTATQKKKAAGTFAKTIAVLEASAVANAVAQSLWDAVRHAGSGDDEDKNYLQRFIEAMGWDFDTETPTDQIYAVLHGNLVDNMNMLNNIPIISDAFSSLDSEIWELAGYTSYSSNDDMSTAWIGHLGDMIKAYQKAGQAMFDDETRDTTKQTGYGVLSKTAQVVSDFLGVPLYAAQRDMVAIYNQIGGRVFGLPMLQTSKVPNKTRTKKDVYETVQTSTDLNEVKAAIDEAVEHHNTYDSINDGLKKNLQETLTETYKQSPSEATKMINRIAEVKAYCSDKEGSLEGKTHSEKVEYYKKNIKKWLE